MHKIRRTLGAEHSRRAGRAGSVQADCDNVRESNMRFLGGNLETVFDLLQADFGSLLGERRMLAQAFDQELLLLIHQRIVDGGSAQIHSGDNLHGCPPSRICCRQLPDIADNLSASRN